MDPASAQHALGTTRSRRSGCSVVVIGLVVAVAVSVFTFVAFQRGPLHAVDCYFSSRDGWSIAFPTEQGSLSQFRKSIRDQSRNCVGVVVDGPTADDAEVVSPIGTSTWISGSSSRNVSVSTRSAGTAAPGPADEPGMEVVLIGERVRDSFCIERTCWPIAGTSMIESGQLSRVSGVLSELGFRMTMPTAPYPDLQIDSNSMENKVQLWLADRPELNAGETAGLEEGRAWVWLEAIDPDIRLEFEAEFGDEVEIDAATIILNSSIEEYRRLHEQIGTQPDPEPRVECLADSGGQELCRVVAYAHNSGAVALAEAADAGDEMLSLLVQETDCANGRTPAEEDIVLLVDETESSIRVGVLFVRPPGSSADCPGNPVVAVSVALDALIGDREVVDYGSGKALPLGNPTDG